jgi:hypothetical protein
MLGFADLGVFLAYVMTVLVTLGCVVYGMVMWNREGEEPPPPPDDLAWVREEQEIEETLG